MNLFRTPKWDSVAREWTRPLDRKYLRVCAVYKLLKRRKIGRAKALELLAARHTLTEMRALTETVSIWRQYPLKDMLP